MCDGGESTLLINTRPELSPHVPPTPLRPSVARWLSRRPSTEQSSRLSCSAVVCGACHWAVEEHVV